MTVQRQRQHELRERLLRLIESVSDQLPLYTVALVHELIDAAEWGVAVETMSEVLVEEHAAVDAGFIDEVGRLVTLMGLDYIVVERLMRDPRERGLPGG